MNNICNKNDFTIKLRLSDKDGVVLPYTQFDWDIWFYTTKNKPFRTYCKDGVINTGTTVVGEYLYITVNGFDWGYSGSVYLKVFTTFANSLYIDGKETFSNNPYLVTSFCITDGFSVVDAAEEDDAGVIIANVDIEEDLVIPFRVGLDGKNVYVAYASDANGTDFSLTPADNLHYIAFLNIAETISDPTPDDFEGLWNMYVGKDAFEIWLLDNEGASYQDYLNWQRQPATDAAASIGELEDEIESAEALRVLAEQSRVAAEAIREDNEDDRVFAEQGRVLAEETREENEAARQLNTTTAINNAEAATDYALETATHPTYIESDYYVVEWNHETQSYNKTNIFVKGEPFSISKTYSSIDDMEADYDTEDVKVGQFVIITSNIEDPDNAKLYVKGNLSWSFITDMSGAIGFTGHTPQFSIGTITSVNWNEDVSASLTPDGYDDNGNPKYLLNLSIPRGKSAYLSALDGGLPITITESQFNEDLAQVPNKINKDGSNSLIETLTFKAVDKDANEISLTLLYNTVEGTYDWQLPNGVTGQVFQELFIYGKATEAIVSGDVIQYVGSQGDHITVKKAVPSEIKALPRLILGVATEDASNGDFFNITCFGNVNDVNTSAWGTGILYYDSESAFNGKMKGTKPTAPNPVIVMGAVIRPSTDGNSNGRILVRPAFYGKITQQDDVYAPVLTAGDVLRWTGTRFEIFNLDAALNSKLNIADITYIIPINIVDNLTVLATGDAQKTFTVPLELNGKELLSVAGAVDTVSTSGLPTFQMRDIALGVDILSTALTIDANEYNSYTALTAAVINPTYKTLYTGQRIAFDCDVAGTGTKGYTIYLKVK